MKKKAEELIRSLVPELQELKEGQELASKLKYGYGANITNVVGDKQGTIVVETRLDRSLLILNEPVIFNEYNVVGFDIHLEHIVLAVERVFHSYLEMYSKKTFGITMLVWRNGAGKQVDYNYNKPFQEQSEEFYKFLVDILK